mmetsp:Transcript_758/g.2105  ORF Transcript_758/g.2105 Transcript_758/m.2105 type:complete len:523 (-) Transcript_758:1600-3168(-)
MLRDHAAAAGIVLRLWHVRLQELVKNLAPVDTAADDDMISTPAVVRPGAVGGQRATEVRVRHDDHVVEDTLLGELPDEVFERPVDLREVLREPVSLAGMRVEACELNEEQVPLREPEAPPLDQAGHLLQLLSEARARRVGGRRLERHVIEDGTQRLAAADVVRERSRVLLAIHTAVLLPGDAADCGAPDLVPVEADGAASLIDDVGAGVVASRPGRRARDREGRDRLAVRGGERVRHPPPRTPRRRAGDLTLERVCRRLQVRVGEEAQAGLGTAAPESVPRHGLHEGPDAADEGRLPLLLVQLPEERQRWVDAELAARLRARGGHGQEAALRDGHARARGRVLLVEAAPDGDDQVVRVGAAVQEQHHHRPVRAAWAGRRSRLLHGALPAVLRRPEGLKLGREHHGLLRPPQAVLLVRRPDQLPCGRRQAPAGEQDVQLLHDALRVGRGGGEVEAALVALHAAAGAAEAVVAFADAVFQQGGHAVEEPHGKGRGEDLELRSHQRLGLRLRLGLGVRPRLGRGR